MIPLRVVVADDEPVALQLLADWVDARPDLVVVDRCPHGLAAVEAIRHHRPDIALLDIRMPELDGLEVVDALATDERPVVVFVTAHDEHAMAAFQRHAVAYLLKPFDRPRFDATLDHVLGLLGGGGGPGGAADTGAADDLDARVAAAVRQVLDGRGPRYLVARGERRSHLVPVAGIDWLEADGDWVRLHCGGRTHLVDDTLRDLVERLEPAGFARIHRSAAVNLDRVREFRTGDGRDYTVVLTTGRSLRLSRTWRPALEDRLGGRL